MMESSDLIDALWERIDIKREYLNKEKSISDTERAAWGAALEWCHNTLCVLSEAQEETQIPELPEGLVCENCDD